jgi:hypothetical protein
MEKPIVLYNADNLATLSISVVPEHSAVGTSDIPVK